MNKFKDFTKEVFKRVDWKEEPVRACLDTNELRPDCPSKYEAFVNAFSTSLRVSQRMRNLVSLAGKLDKLHAKVMAHIRMKKLIEEVDNIVDETFMQVQCEDETVGVLFRDRNVSSEMNKSLKEKLLEHSELKRMDNSVHFALLALIQCPGTCELKDPNEFPSGLHVRALAEQYQERPDKRPLVHLVGVVSGLEPEEASDAVDALQALWADVRDAWLADQEDKFSEKSNLIELSANVKQLHSFVIKEIEKTARSDCKFLKVLCESETYSLGEVIKQFGYDAARRKVERRASNGAGGGEL